MIVDLFAGPGGWDHGARLVGLPDPIGIEHGKAECDTRRLSGFPTIRADVSTLVPPPGLAGLIASPPCPAFSVAGDGRGRDRIPEIIDAALACDFERLRADADPGVWLVLEPLRWALACRPVWCAWEQVPPVLPVWEACAAVLRAAGFRVWTGVLNSADYGVPQTRRRAFVMASQVADPHPPMPTHTETPGMFTQAWVSMAEALGWADDVFVSQLRGKGMAERHGERRARPAAEPSPTLAAGHSGPRWTLDRRAGRPDADGRYTAAPVLDVGQSPAPTLTSTSIGSGVWVLHANTQANAAARRQDEPAPTITAAMDNGCTKWVFERLATSVCGDPRLSPPGWRGRPDDYDADGTYRGERSMEQAIKLTERDGLILQGFPPDTPIAGNKSERWRQIGNAVPPPLAAAVLAGVTRGAR